MKILLIGHSIIDRIAGKKDNTPKPGGLFYSTLGMLSASNAEDNIFAVTSWNDESVELFNNVYSKINLSLSNQMKVIPEVILKTSGEGEREEVYKNLSSGLNLEKIPDWNSFNGILINMITGFDISLEQLKFIRKNYHGKIYIDIHTLSRGVDENMKREFRPIPNSDEWLACVNIIQVNDSELRTVADANSEYNCAQKILGFGTEILIVTKGKKGANLYMKLGSSIKLISAEGLNVKSINKIGCGDIFGAVFFYSYISTNDVEHSLARANKAGAIASSIKELTKFSVIDLND